MKKLDVLQVFFILLVAFSLLTDFCDAGKIVKLRKKRKKIAKKLKQESPVPDLDKEARNLGFSAGIGSYDTTGYSGQSYDVNAGDLLAVESQAHDFPYEYATPTASSAEGQFGDKTFTQISETLGNAFGGGEDQTLIQAALPVAVFAFLALTASAVFPGQVQVNATAKQDVPLLWPFPNLFDRNGLFGPKDDDNGRGARHIDNNLVEDSSFLGNFGSIAHNLQSGMIMYTLMEKDKECREKIACKFGTEARKSRYMNQIVPLVERFLPNRLSDFKTHFMAATEREDVDGGGSFCDKMQCNKCFKI